jgi:DNA-binding winged helix-turn-helix (wHTH) protein
LRKALSNDGKEARYIETVPLCGHEFTFAVALEEPGPRLCGLKRAVDLPKTGSSFDFTVKL